MILIEKGKDNISISKSHGFTTKTPIKSSKFMNDIKAFLLNTYPGHDRKHPSVLRPVPWLGNYRALF
ncbi:hypothetical protein GCM10011339_30850 [Echinicola rosea]|uniref:Uncharacterized protein n=1 Tax=Echinicola rosea TaxID=1807691 RepID=A0ABQ1V7B8_9BACT|nr:hypothetical protein GCM10011339_30850 [Echinicola rosea]